MLAMYIEQDIKLNFDDVLIKPKRSETGSRAEVNLFRNFKMRNAKPGEYSTTRFLDGIPIFAANMDCVGTFAMCKALAKDNIFTCLHKFYSEEKLIEFFGRDRDAMYAFYTTGITDKDIDKLKSVAKSATIDGICLDVANGYTKFFVDKVRQIRELFPQAVIMAGNVVTGDMTQELIVNGADIVKVGLGSGSVCETRKVTGVGYPQLSAVIECANVAHGLNAHICSDGGCSTSGDICKAIGGGSDFVMLGTMLSGHDECEGAWTYEPKYEWHDGTPDYPTPGLCQKGTQKKSLKFYGMSSVEAMEQYYGGVATHRAPEGKCIEVPYKGPVEGTIKNILGGIRSACAYIGTNDIKNFSKCTTFIMVK